MSQLSQLFSQFFASPIPDDQTEVIVEEGPLGLVITNEQPPTVKEITGREDFWRIRGVTVGDAIVSANDVAISDRTQLKCFLSTFPVRLRFINQEGAAVLKDDIKKTMSESVLSHKHSVSARSASSAKKAEASRKPVVKAATTDGVPQSSFVAPAVVPTAVSTPAFVDNMEVNKPASSMPAFVDNMEVNKPASSMSGLIDNMEVNKPASSMSGLVDNMEVNKPSSSMSGLVDNMEINKPASSMPGLVDNMEINKPSSVVSGLVDNMEINKPSSAMSIGNMEINKPSSSRSVDNTDARKPTVNVVAPSGELALPAIAEANERKGPSTVIYESILEEQAASIDEQRDLRFALTETLASGNAIPAASGDTIPLVASGKRAVESTPKASKCCFFKKKPATKTKLS